MFKSYYVVWKQKYILLRSMKKIGLNRTMQYGNAKEKDIFMYIFRV